MLFVVYNQLFFYYIHFQQIIFLIFTVILHNYSLFGKLEIVEIFVHKKCYLVLRRLWNFGILAV